MAKRLWYHVRMDERCRFKTRNLLEATLWIALACLAWRVYAFPDSHPWIRMSLICGLALVLVVSPFAAIGGLVDRAVVGALCGLGLVLLLVFVAIFI
jgi:hypothetical protein